MSYKLKASSCTGCWNAWCVQCFPKQTEADILKVFSSSHIKGSLPRGICVKAIAMSLYLAMTVLLSFMKLMQNALGGVLPLMCTFFLIKVGCTILHFTICRKDKIAAPRPNRASKSCQSQTWLCLSGGPWVLCMCQRSGVTAGDAVHFSQWNLSSTWGSRLESDNRRWLVTSMFSLNLYSLPNIIYWWYLPPFLSVRDLKYAGGLGLLMCATWLPPQHFKKWIFILFWLRDV